MAGNKVGEGGKKSVFLCVCFGFKGNDQYRSLWEGDIKQRL